MSICRARLVATLRSCAVLVVVLVGASRTCLADPPPSSARSREAIERVRPRLAEALRAKGLRFGSPIFIRVFKESSELEVWVENDEGAFELFRTWAICSFSGGLGPKIVTGDMQSPEGFYYVTPHRMNPHSRFHLSFDVGYPNVYDRAHGRTGSALMVHGGCVSNGCYAMTDAGIEEIFTLADAALRNGQPFFRVHVFPFRPTAAAMRRHQSSPWISFWENLSEGYYFFETSKRPPNVIVRDGAYRFQQEAR